MKGELKNIMQIQAEVDIETILELVFERVADQERHDLVLWIATNLAEEIQAYGGRLSEVSNIQEAINILNKL